MHVSLSFLIIIFLTPSLFLLALYPQMDCSSYTPSKGPAYHASPSSPSLKDVLKNEVFETPGDRKAVGDDGVIDHRLLLMKSINKPNPYFCSGQFSEGFP